MIYVVMRVYAFNDLLKALLCVYAFLRNLPASNTRPIYFKSTGKDWLARASNCFCQTHVYVYVPSVCEFMCLCVQHELQILTLGTLQQYTRQKHVLKYTEAGTRRGG